MFYALHVGPPMSTQVAKISRDREGHLKSARETHFRMVMKPDARPDFPENISC